MTFKIGCQTYTWQMSFDRYADQLEDILGTIEQAGFAGVEPEVCMLGPYRNQPEQLVADIERRNLHLGALTLALPWANAEETPEEKAEAGFVFDYLKHFPGTLLVLVNLPGEDRSNLAERQKNALACINEVAKRASSRGINCAFHPNSPTGSIFRIKEDYDVMFASLDTRYIGYVPDTGHIANGGMDPEEVIQTHRSIIRHVHFKDISEDGQWTSMGQGRINHPAILKFLHETDYSDWIMVEEESDEAAREPQRYTLHNGNYMSNVMKTINTR